jgi:Holliday junction resolvase-like predicted endonuclease
MGVNKYQKGNRRELEARKMLEEQGYLVDKKPRTKWHSPDLFGMFDLLAIKGDECLLIQVKSNKSDFYKSRKALRAWTKSQSIQLPCYIYLKENNKPWRKEKI